ncbi:MAG: AbrB/MazE/SpoVT family DNA-binding domain-containing protein [Candidatus Nitrosocaldus sp.]|nr:AbrB/MazE/SpoVT family DNA-binding domain-containing protein [Candidatus Nitrosocaldus sp.]MDW8000515.1 AbrB/MazE/SpoVT family DNA-binding domain-containing protein [Candidatus Nitrosocaldus sp.]MDW8275454.1 AbrB/MazE/SpoVT family DNA-binding domain-containing protein [Candidatus Nitrosocaldus sp.]
MDSVMKMDEKGRITIPKEIRDRVRSKRFRIDVEDEKIILLPIRSEAEIERYYGIFCGNVGDMDVDKILRDGLRKRARELMR